MVNKYLKVIVPFVLSLPFFYFTYISFGNFSGVGGLVLLVVNGLCALLYLVTKKNITYFIPLILLGLVSIAAITYIYVFIGSNGGLGYAILVIFAIQMIGISIFSVGLYYLFEYIDESEIEVVNKELKILSHKDLVFTFLLIYTIYTYYMWISAFGEVSIFGTIFMVIVFGVGLGLLGLLLNRFVNIREYNLSLVISGIMIFSLFRYHINELVINRNYIIVIDILYFSFVLLLLIDLLVRVINKYKKA